jgi:hypothetical protein
MPTKNSAQIGTIAPRVLKKKWEAECVRLRDELDLTYHGRSMFPGNLVLGLIASFLKKDKAERERLAPQALIDAEAFDRSGASSKPEYRGVAGSVVRVRAGKSGRSDESVG